MDKDEIVKDEKIERIPIILMNQALHKQELGKNDIQFFSVQSECNVWPIGTFCVIKESHEYLK